MTEKKKSIIPSIVGAVLAGFIFIIILATVLTSIQPFHLDIFSADFLLTRIPVGDYLMEVANTGTMLWGYRGIDSILQGLLLVSAAIGASILFRLEKGKEETKEE